MESWGLAEAKAQFSEVVMKAMTEGPQEITRNGREAVVMVSKREWIEKSQPKESLVEFFKRSPAYGMDIKLKRVNLKPRKIDF